MTDEKGVAQESPAATTLPHVNTPPAQTWNYLRVNDVSFDVPAAPKGGNVFDPLPRVLDGIEVGLGDEAARWVSAAAGKARFVNVPAGSALGEPIVVDVSADEGAVLDTGVYVREGASATIVVAAQASLPTRTSSASLLRVYADRDAHVRIVEVVAMGDEHQHLEGVGVRAMAGAKVQVEQYLLGGGKVAAGLAVDLAGDRSALDLTCRYYAEGAQQLDITHTVRARGRNTREDLVAQGLLADSAKKTLRETIDLVHGSAGSAGNEAETVLVTGDGVVNKTLPVILCDEDDVQGNHGATIGSISPEQLAYLAGRGLSAEDAERLFARAIFDDAVLHAPEDVSRAAAVMRASKVLGNEVGRDLAQGLSLGADGRE